MSGGSRSAIDKVSNASAAQVASQKAGGIGVRVMDRG